MAGVDTNDPKDLPETTEYKVVITRIRKNVKVRGKEYEDLGTTRASRNGGEEKEYGYVYFDEFVTKESEIYSQNVDDIDLPTVIKAVNKMEN